MTWFKVDDRFDEHPRFVGLSDKAVALWFKGLAYCSRHLTDGRIPRGMLRRLDATQRTAQLLVEAGLWEEWPDFPDDYIVHNYLKHQRSRTTTEQQRAAGAERVRRHRQRNAVTDAVTNTEGTIGEVEEESRDREEELEKLRGGPGEGAEMGRLAVVPWDVVDIRC